MTWNYSEKTTELFMAAVQGKPGTHLGEIEDADGFGEHGSIACGDALRFTFKVDRHATDPLKDRIVEARYLTFGCTSAIAASEALCAIIEEGDYTPVDALKITNQDIVTYLDGLPQAKIHCSVMGAEALEAAVFNWAQKRGVDLAELGVDIRRDEQEEGRLVCTCFGLTEPYIERKIQELDLKTIPYVLQFNKRDLPNIAPVHYLDFLLNQRATKAEYFETVAVKGIGVSECLNLICKILMAQFIEQHNMSASGKKG